MIALDLLAGILFFLRIKAILKSSQFLRLQNAQSIPGQNYSR